MTYDIWIVVSIRVKHIEPLLEMKWHTEYCCIIVVSQRRKWIDINFPGMISLRDTLFESLIVLSGAMRDIVESYYKDTEKWYELFDYIFCNIKQIFEDYTP